MRSCTKSSNEMIPCIMESKPLALSWGRTPRLDSGMRVQRPGKPIIRYQVPPVHKSVSKDSFPKSSEFNAEHYATLVAYPAPFHKYLEPFLSLIGISQMDLFSFISTTDPTKVRVVAPAHGESELEDSVDRLFDEGGSGDQAGQGDSPRRQRKRKTVVVDAGEPSHPAKKLRDNHGASTGPSMAGKSRSALQSLLTGTTTKKAIETGQNSP
ncbi:hypothetical protein Tco_1415546 [Tanacetum coccineum]